MTQQQVQIAAQRVNDELENITMSWDNQLRQWHPTALHALTFANSLSLNIPSQRFIDLFTTDPKGMNMNIVAILCNNCEARTPHEMGVSAKDWAIFLAELNFPVAKRWTEMKLPIEKRILKQMEIMNGRQMIVSKQ